LKKNYCAATGKALPNFPHRLTPVRKRAISRGARKEKKQKAQGER
jgi:hypothetical protein